MLRVVGVNFIFKLD